MNALGSFIQDSPLFFNLVQDHLVILFHFVLEVLSVLESLLYLGIENGLVFDFLITILQELLSQLLYLFNLLIEFVNGHVL